MIAAHQAGVTEAAFGDELATRIVFNAGAACVHSARTTEAFDQFMPGRLITPIDATGFCVAGPATRKG